MIAGEADVVLVDELAHGAPDSGRGRWQDVTDLLDAGIDVLTSTNVSNIRSVRDYAARITGAGESRSSPMSSCAPARLSWSTWRPRRSANGSRPARCTRPAP